MVKIRLKKLGQWDGKTIMLKVLSKKLDAISAFVDRVAKVLSISLLFCIFLLTVVNALSRYLIHINFLWAYDWMRVMFLAFVFISVTIIYKSKEHAKFVFLESRFTPWVRYCVNMVTYLLSMILFVAIVWKGSELCFSTSVQTLPASGISAMWLYVSLVVGMFFNGCHAVSFIVQETYEQLKKQVSGIGA